MVTHMLVMSDAFLGECELHHQDLTRVRNEKILALVVETLFWTMTIAGGVPIHRGIGIDFALALRF